MNPFEELPRKPINQSNYCTRTFIFVPCANGLALSYSPVPDNFDGVFQEFSAWQDVLRVCVEKCCPGMRRDPELSKEKHAFSNYHLQRGEPCAIKYIVLSSYPFDRSVVFDRD